jgi:cysteine desulfurase
MQGGEHLVMADRSRIYLDHASTTPLDPEVREAMLPYLGDRFGNPSSPNLPGRSARRVIDEARDRVAGMLGARVEEIVFTGSASEANNLALKGIALAARRRGGHLVAASTEHASVLHPLRTLARQGFNSTLLPVDRFGVILLDRLQEAVDNETLLISIAHASPEIGTLQPIAEICALAQARGIAVHCDATVTAGLLPWPPTSPSPDLVTVTPHLFYGPPGIGALRVRQGIRLAPLIEGGQQEGGLRAGTESLAAIAGFGAAAAMAVRRRQQRATRASWLARRMLDRLQPLMAGMVTTGHPNERVPGLLTLCFRGIEAEALLQALQGEGIDAASGSACTTEVGKSSHVLEAIGIDPIVARGALSLAFGEASEDSDPDRVADVLPRLVSRLRDLSPLENM